MPAGEAEARMQRFIEIDQAWKILGNEETKKEYDLQRRGRFLPRRAVVVAAAALSGGKCGSSLMLAFEILFVQPKHFICFYLAFIFGCIIYIDCHICIRQLKILNYF